MINKQNKKRLPLKTVYYLSFLFFIVIPILIVLVVSLLALNQQFKKQAIENIKQSQETIMTQLFSDINVMSMRLSHLIYTNNNQVLGYAAGTDTSDSTLRYQFEQQLASASNLVLEPVKDIISVGFYMKSGRQTYVKAPIKKPASEIQSQTWYQQALKNPNSVCIGSYDTESMNDLYTGGKKDSLILVFALAPDITTDRSEQVEMVAFYQSTKAAEYIRKYNSSYLNKTNKLGITFLRDKAGNILFSTAENSDEIINAKHNTKVVSPITFLDTTWYLESYIKTSDLTADYWNSAYWILFVAILILGMFGYYSRYFLRSIVNPIEAISSGLREVEEGNLDIHVSATGQFELRSMVHQFNAMVRRLKALIGEYEEKVKNITKNPQDYFTDLVQGELTPQEVTQRSKEFFAEPYAILGIYLEYENAKFRELASTPHLISCFEYNARFASRCLLSMERPTFGFLFYRITEEDYTSAIHKMVLELQRIVSKEFSAKMSVCIGTEGFGSATFEACVEEVRSNICLRHLLGSDSIIELDSLPFNYQDFITQNYHSLSIALYTADEKVITTEKEKLYESFDSQPLEDAFHSVYAAILAIGECFDSNSSPFSDVFGQPYNYVDKLSRIHDIRSLKLWIANYFAWIIDYSASKLNMAETDVIIKAKRYILDHYEDANLSLLEVANYIGLNEKYFTNRFTKETGETFSSYLTGLRMQKAKDLLKSTSFKVYEISEMVGYHNVEHFNRMFKKMNHISPVQYRKL